MLNSSFDNKFTSFDLGSSIVWTDPNIANLPPEIKSSQQFCFWKYELSKENKKLKKVPYGYSKSTQCLERSLLDPNKMFSFSDFLELRHKVPKDYNLGLVLTHGPFAVIDIDNYQSYAPLLVCLIKVHILS